MENTLEFSNVTLYRVGIFGVSAINCKTLEVTTGVKYAQYTDAIRFVYLEKGKRKRMAGVLADSKPWCRVVDSSKAIEPADPLIPTDRGGQVSRYSSCDPRYVIDFEDALASAEVPILFGVGDYNREAA